MKLLRSVSITFAASALVSIIACSSESSSSASASCDQAKSVADSCNAQPKDGGASVTVTFDAAKCAESDQGKKVADCIVANKSNCDCVLKCSLTGSC